MDSIFNLSVIIAAVDNLTGPVREMVRSMVDLDRMAARGREMQDWGTEVHLAMQKRFQKDIAFPLGMKQFEPLVAPLVKLPGAPLVEQKLAPVVHRNNLDTDAFTRSQ